MPLCILTCKRKRITAAVTKEGCGIGEWAVAKNVLTMNCHNVLVDASFFFLFFLLLPSIPQTIP